MEIKTFKGFKKNLQNKYGENFELGLTYTKNPNTLKFGEQGHGYHVAAQLADTFRFFNPCLDNVYCEVLGSGQILKEEGYLYQSDAMYVVERLKIVKILTREDILQYAYQADINELQRYLGLFPFNKEELETLRSRTINRLADAEKIIQESLIHHQGNPELFKRNPKYLRKVFY